MKTLHQFDEVFDTQAVFRKVLEAMSNPTRTVSVAEQMEKLFGNHRAFLALGMTLLDNEATFSACGDADFGMISSWLRFHRKKQFQRQIICS